jgi:hypothetical protein
LSQGSLQNGQPLPLVDLVGYIASLNIFKIAALKCDKIIIKVTTISDPLGFLATPITLFKEFSLNPKDHPPPPPPPSGYTATVKYSCKVEYSF